MRYKEIERAVSLKAKIRAMRRQAAETGTESQLGKHTILDTGHIPKTANS
jgi:hypothetical protein